MAKRETQATRLAARHQEYIDSLIARGFNERGACDACEMLRINGILTHETGCRNARHECEGCNALLPVNQRYCEDCR